MPRESNDAGAKPSVAISEDQRLVRARMALAISVVVYYPGTEEAHTNPTRQRGECLRALAGASG
jgi:hypothetical protein